MSTGDEVVEPGETVPAGGIYDANRHTLMAVLSELGCDVRDFGIIPDDPERISKALVAAACDCDAVISTAGMSVGEEDHLADAIRAIGSLHFWKVAIKPGRPIAFGQIDGRGNRSPTAALPCSGRFHPPQEGASTRICAGASRRWRGWHPGGPQTSAQRRGRSVLDGRLGRAG